MTNDFVTLGPSPQTGTVAVADGRLHYLDWGGRGTPAHLLHANGFCAGTYTPFVRRLACHLRVVASDVRGHGDSLRLESHRIRHWEVFSNDLASLVSATLPLPAVGIGHSLGAVTTILAAARQPELFAAIVLLDPPILVPRRLLAIALLKRLGLGHRLPLARGARRRTRQFRSKRAAFERFAAGRGIFKTWTPDFIDAYLECGLVEKDASQAVLKCDPELEAQIFESIPTDIWRHAGRVRCPVLLLRGRHSETLQPAAAHRLVRRMADCRLQTVERAGHFLPMERPGACVEAILQFLDHHRLLRPELECTIDSMASGSTG